MITMILSYKFDVASVMSTLHSFTTNQLLILLILLNVNHFTNATVDTTPPTNHINITDETHNTHSRNQNSTEGYPGQTSAADSTSNESDDVQCTTLSPTTRNESAVVEDAYNYLGTTRIRPIVVPAKKMKTAVFIFLHDYGQFGPPWKSKLIKARPLHMKLVLPSARIIHLGWYRGKLVPAWFNFGDPRWPHNNTDFDDLANATAYVHKMIRHEENFGIPSDRIVLGGLAQGATLALHAALAYPKKLAGVVALSIWKPYPQTLEPSFNLANKDIPIFHGHVKNRYVKDEEATNIAKLLIEKVSKDVEFTIYSGEFRTTPSELEDVRLFFNRIVPSPELYTKAPKKKIYTTFKPKENKNTTAKPLVVKFY